MVLDEGSNPDMDRHGDTFRHPSNRWNYRVDSTNRYKGLSHEQIEDQEGQGGHGKVCLLYISKIGSR